MKSLSTLFVVLIVLSVVGILFYIDRILFDDNYDINPGEKWEYVLNYDNPFKDPIVYRYEILDVKDGYVLYVKNETDTLSSRIGYFVSGSNCVKNCK